MNPKLLTRDEFRASVFKRDNNACVICGRKASDGHKLDAHHIIERRLFIHPGEQEGYFTDNGASLCDQEGSGCHAKAEMTIISCDEIRAKAGIKKVILPKHLYAEFSYDKWGNPFVNATQRLRGELFFDENVQKILHAGGQLTSFSTRVKHPRTSHLPWSEGATEDDEFVPHIKDLSSGEVVATVKYDGEQTSIYSDCYVHARSTDGRHASSQNWVRNFVQSWAWNLPAGWRLCGENMYEEHTIGYKGLGTYFFAHSIWNEKNVRIAYDDFLEWCRLLDVQPVPEIYRGPYNEKVIKDLIRPQYQNNPMEGYVLSTTRAFNLTGFSSHVAKFVAKDFGRNRDSRHGTRSGRRNGL